MPWSIAVLKTHLSHQRLQLWLVDEGELRDEVIIVFVAGVDVSFCPHTANDVKVMNVDVYEHPKQPAQDLLADLLEVLRKRDSYE